MQIPFDSLGKYYKKCYISPISVDLFAAAEMKYLACGLLLLAVLPALISGEHLQWLRLDNANCGQCGVYSIYSLSQHRGGEWRLFDL